MSAFEGSLSVPGNLLLLGEYAVVEPGGLGVAIAVDKRVHLSWTPAPTLSVTGTWGAGRVVWPGPGSGLFDAVLQTICVSADLEVAIRVDSSAFFDGDRGKKGFGSSAAVTVALTAGLLSLIGRVRADHDQIFPVAIAAHRRFQGGLGSGYDVATSLHGGIGLFEGGTEPGWQPLVLPWLPELGLFTGRAPVGTTGAVGRYRDWKAREPEAARAFLERSNRLVRSFAEAGDWQTAREIFLACSRVGRDLGESIGVPADIRPPFSGNDCYKAVGAGDELGVVLGCAAEATVVGLAEIGLTWD